MIVQPQQLELRIEEPESAQPDPLAGLCRVERSATRVVDGVTLKANYRHVTYRNEDGEELAQGVVKIKARRRGAKSRAKPKPTSDRLLQLERLQADHRWLRTVHPQAEGSANERMTFHRRQLAG